MRVVVSDTSPIHYLVLIGEADILAKLYGRVLVPSSVAIELNQSRTPGIVREWILSPPPWVEIVPVGLGVLDQAAALGFLDLAGAIERLRATNFRAPAALLDHLIAEDSRRRKS